MASTSSLCLCPTSEPGRNRSQITPNPRSRTFYVSPAWYLPPTVPTTEGTLGSLCKETVTEPVTAVTSGLLGQMADLAPTLKEKVK